MKKHLIPMSTEKGHKSCKQHRRKKIIQARGAEVYVQNLASIMRKRGYRKYLARNLIRAGYDSVSLSNTLEWEKWLLIMSIREQGTIYI